MRNKVVIFVSIFCFASLRLDAQITPAEAFEQMGRGINMGNTLEAPSEGAWSAKAEEYYFDDYKSAGFSTVRIPVRWYPYTEATAPYNISSVWMDRVETVVDWALSRGLFVIINCHHSEPIKEDYDGNKAKWDSIWVQVSERFKDKSEKLFFEMMNEPNGWTIAQTNDFNKRTLGIIRKTNPTRIVIYSGNNWSAAGDLTNVSLEIPDVNDPYLIGTYHSYDPWRFGGEGKGTWGTLSDKNAVAFTFRNVANWSKQKNIPVLIGEFGSTYVNDDGGESDLNSRFRHYACYVENAIKNNIRFTVWDDGGWFEVYKRGSKSWHESKDILIHYSPQSVTDFTAVNLEDGSVSLQWKNQASVYDSITIERKRDGWEEYEVIGKVNSGVTTFVDTELFLGYKYYYRVITHQADTAASWGYPQWIQSKAVVQSPYNDNPHAVPGTIEAEEFDLGIQDLSYFDMTVGNEGNVFRTDVDVDIEQRSDGGFQIAWIEAGEWLEYSIDIANTSDYIISTHAASKSGGGRFQLIFERGQAKIWTVPETGDWQKDTIISQAKLRLPAGQQMMKINVLEGGFTIDKLVFVDSKQTGINNLASHQLKIFPNPTKGELTIQSEGFNFDDIELINLSGQVLFSDNIDLQTANYKVSTSGLKNGLYLLKISKQGEYITRKVTIIN